MLDWLKRKATPIPSEQSLDSGNHPPATEKRLERLLDRLGTDGKMPDEPAAPVDPLPMPGNTTPSITVDEPSDQAFDAAHYQNSLAFFTEALMEGGGGPQDDVRTIAAKVIGSLREGYGVTPDHLTAMRPYLVQFVKDVRDGVVQFGPERRGPPGERRAAAEEQALPAVTDVIAPPAGDNKITAASESAASEIALASDPDSETAAEPEATANAIAAVSITEAKTPVEPEAALQTIDSPPKIDEETPAAPAVLKKAAPPPADIRPVGEATGGSRMLVIAVASQKGGVGKTTIAAHLAVRAGAVGQGPAVLIDTDPQGSLGEWWRARKSDVPALATVKLEDLAANLTELRGYGTSVAIIDTPPALTASIEQVIAVADLVLIPARPSPHDLRAVGATVEMVRRAGKPFLFVVNGAAPRASITAQAVAALSEHGRVVPVILYQRTDYAASMIDGRTVMETAASGRSAQEIAELWQYVYEQIGMRVAA